MREDIYKAALAFLNRVDLKGSEVGAFEAVKQAITECYQSGMEQPKDYVEENAEEG